MANSNDIGGSPMEEQSPTLGQVLQPQDDISAAMMVPAKDAGEVSQRAAGWKQMFEDPKFKQALLFFGTSLMQPRAPGQTAAGQLGGAITVGASAYNLLGQQEQQRSIQERVLAGQEEERKSRLALTNEQLATAKQNRLLTEQRTPNILREDKLRLDRLEAEIARAKTAEEKDRLANAHQEIINKYAAEVSEAEIAQRRGAAAASGAHAAYYGAAGREQTAKAGERELETEILRKVQTGGIESLTPGERTLFETRLDPSRTRATATAGAATMKMLRDEIKRANPTWGEEQVSAELLRMQGEKKGFADELKAIELMQNSSDRAIRQQADERLKALVSSRGVGEPRGGAAPGAPAAPKVSPEGEPVAPLSPATRQELLRNLRDGQTYRNGPMLLVRRGDEIYIIGQQAPQPAAAQPRINPSQGTGLVEQIPGR